MKNIMTPAISLLNHFSFSKKFLLLFFIIFLTVGVLVGSVMLKVNQELTFVKKELYGTELLSEFYPLIQLTQQHRGLTVNVLSGDTGSISTLHEVQTKILDQLESVENTLLKQSSLNVVSEDYHMIVSEWEKTKNTTLQMNVPDAVSQHNQLIAIMVQTLLDVSDESNLTLDTDLVNNHKINLLLHTLPQITEMMGK